MASTLKRSKLPSSFQARVLKGNKKGEGYREYNQLLDIFLNGGEVTVGDASGISIISLLGSNQSGVYMLVGSMSSSSSTGWGLSFCRTTHIFAYILLGFITLVITA